MPHRRAKRYLNNFDSIWRLQSFLLSEADRCDVPIIPNEDKEKSILQIIQQVNVELARHFTGTTEQIFGAIAGEVKEQAETSSWREIVPLLRDLSQSLF